MRPESYRHVITALWSAWGLYWLLSALGNKGTVRRESLASRLAYVLPLFVGGVLMLSSQLPWEWLNARLWPRSLAAYWIGVALLATGLAFSVWARVHLGRNWSGSVTVKQGHELIRTGPYGYVRHPIYTGLSAAVLGTAIAFGTMRAMLGALIIVASFLFKLRLEEVFMRETFPDQYPGYAATVPRLIPFTRPQRSSVR
ncbi:MAG TPA: isoprenylcysteine carboxylmethyltransferase family protein [Steroidobacteraceae bacterium]